MCSEISYWPLCTHTLANCNVSTHLYFTVSHNNDGGHGSPHSQASVCFLPSCHAHWAADCRSRKLKYTDVSFPSRAHWCLHARRKTHATARQPDSHQCRWWNQTHCRFIPMKKISLVSELTTETEVRSCAVCCVLLQQTAQKHTGKVTDSSHVYLDYS